MIKEGNVIYMGNVLEFGEGRKPVKFVVEQILPIKRAFGIEDYNALCWSVEGHYRKCFSKLDLANNGYDTGLPLWR